MDRKKSRLMKREDVLLLVIDMQSRLLPAIQGGDSVLENTRKLIRTANILDVPLLVTEQKKLGNTVEDLPDLPDPIVKRSFDCFRNETFAKAVQSLGKRTILLTGIETHICVAQTAITALEDYKPQVVADATSSRSRRDADLGIERCRDAGVTITSTEMAIYELLGEAGTDEFKQILPIVKASGDG